MKAARRLNQSPEVIKEAISDTTSNIPTEIIGREFKWIRKKERNETCLYFLIWFFRVVCWPGKITESFLKNRD